MIFKIFYYEHFQACIKEDRIVQLIPHISTTRFNIVNTVLFHSCPSKLPLYHFEANPRHHIIFPVNIIFLYTFLSCSIFDIWKILGVQ
jgi:hypothetical protein